MAPQRPPGPRGTPWLGPFPWFARDPLGFLSHMARRYGDTVAYSFAGHPVVQLNHPDDIERLLVGSHKHLVKDQVTQALSVMLGQGLVTSEGELWKRQRRLAAPSFAKKHVDGYGERMVDLAVAWVDGLVPGRRVDVHHEVLGLTRDIVLVCLFGTDPGPEQDIAEPIEMFMGEFLSEAQGWRKALPQGVWTPGRGRIRTARSRIDEKVYGFIDAARARSEGDDVIHRLLAARDEDGQPMSVQQLRDEVITFFTAGHETTAIALTHLLDQLGRHPEVRERLEEEVDRVLDGERPSVAALAELPYTRAVVREVLRLLPPVWAIGRQAIADVELNGFVFPEGTEFFLAQWVVQHDARWFPRPWAFAPERWLDEPSLPKLAWMPFGSGARICIGNHFAMMELELVLAVLAQRRRFRVVDWRPLRLEPTVTLRPRDAVQMQVEAR